MKNLLKGEDVDDLEKKSIEHVLKLVTELNTPHPNGAALIDDEATEKWKKKAEQDWKSDIAKKTEIKDWLNVLIEKG